MIYRKLKISIGLSLFFLPATALAVSTVNSIDFQTVDNSSQLVIQADGPVTYETQENAQDKLIVIELKGAKLGPKALRKLDTSSFNSRIDLISPYQPKDQPDTARIVLHLRDMASAEVTQDKNTITVTIPNSGTAGAANAGAPPKDSPPESSAPPVPQSPLAKSTTDAPPGDASDVKVERSNLDDFVENTETKRFTGKPITLQVRDTELADVLRLIGEASGFNIVVGDGVGGKITLSLIDVPWDQALDVILHTKRLGAERKANILRIVTLQNLTQEKEELFKAKEAAQKSAPRITRIFPISYADAPSLVSILNGFGKSGPSGAPQFGGSQQTGAVAQVSGPVQVDSRTNSLIVQDIPENIERMKKLIELLDTQTPQVMVEAKVVEASETFAKTIQGSLGFGSSTTANPQAFGSFAGGNPLDPLLGTPGGTGNSVFSSGAIAGGTSAAVGPPATASGTFGLSPSISFIPGIARLNALLNFGETENDLKVISAPKLVVLNKKQASILQGTPVLVPQTQNVPGLPASTINTVQNANLSLDVTPTVTNSGSVHMILKISRDVANASTVAPRNMNTEVLVDSGTTLVIGGIYTSQTTHNETGMPILKDLPILGWLFGTKSDSNQRSELFIFITPRVINEEEAGLNG